MRALVAPSARRIAISRRRPTPLASSKLATFAHASRSTRPTAIDKASSAGR